MSEPRWTPEPTEDGVRFTMTPFWSAVCDLMANGFTQDQARALVSLKMREEETDDDARSE